MRNLYLVDVSSMYFRAFYAIRQLSNSKGLPTNALYGFMSMTLKLLREKKPDYMAFCLDRKEPGFRHQIYPDYKANRTEMPEDLQKQVPYVRRIIDSLGIPAYDFEGFEADDVIGTLAEYGRTHDLNVVIVSGDKDFGQLVGPRVSIYDPMKEVVLDPEGVRGKMGVPPELVTDYLALVGDSSDNVPGVLGIGPKGAVKLLTEFGSLDDIYRRIAEVKPEGVAKKLLASKENAFLSKQLVIIRKDVPLKFQMDELKPRPIDPQNLRSLLQELEFKNLEKSFFENAPASQATPSESSANTDLTTPGAVAAEVGAAAGVGRVGAIREERLGLRELADRLQDGSSLWVIKTSQGLALGQADTLYFCDGSLIDLARILTDQKIRWMGYDLKDLWHEMGAENPLPAWDHMLASYVVKAAPQEGFREVYENHVGEKLPDIASPVETYQAHQRLQAVLQERLKQVQGVTVFQEIELPLIPVLYSMEIRGIRVDAKVLSLQNQNLLKEQKEIETQIFSEVGETFNLSSPKQLGQILFEKLKMPTGRKTKTGFSTDSDVLEKLSADYPICRKVIEHRELVKLRSTYIEALPALINSKTGRVHTHFNQAVTTTGRLSSTHPNLQNIPIRTERGNAIRRAFVADDGTQLISADYSQIELRILAHVTEDPGLVRAFQNDQDIHTATAAEVFGVSLAEVSSDQRRMAKAVNFGIAYGMGAFGLAENLGIPRKEAQEIIDRYFQRFSRIQEFMSSIVETAKRQGYVETLYGRRRYLDELKSSNQAIRRFGERAAINAPIQGSASDIVKKAMIQIEGKTNCPLLLQVHDELVFECPIPEVEGQVKLIREEMESVVRLKVPLRVDVAVQSSWA